MDDKIITVEQLREKLNNQEPVFILDVRPADQRKEWRIAGSVHVDAYKSLNTGDHSVLNAIDIPDQATVVTVCAAGRTSLIASKALQERGVDAFSLQGGMKAWNYAWNTAEHTGKHARIIQVRRAAKGVLSYVVGSANEAFVIDAALDPKVYQDIARANGWTIMYVMDTHIHADYVSRSRELARATGAQHLMIDSAKIDFDHVSVSENTTIKIGNAAMTFLHTPGHTWESTAIILDDDAVFTGDTLFVDGIGRPDLKADHAEAIDKARALHRSVRQILALTPEAVVLPAHTSNAVGFDGKLIGDTIHNIRSRMRAVDTGESEFVTYALSRVPPTPPNYMTIAAINRKGSYDGVVLADLEAGGNHCAIA